jgi:hypothetical protein
MLLCLHRGKLECNPQGITFCCTNVRIHCCKKTSFHNNLGLTGWKFTCTHGRCHQATNNTATKIGKENNMQQSCSMCPMEASEQCGWNIKVRFDRNYTAGET